MLSTIVSFLILFHVFIQSSKNFRIEQKKKARVRLKNESANTTINLPRKPREVAGKRSDSKIGRQKGLDQISPPFPIEKECRKQSHRTVSVEKQ
jgi:hypothetical protein